MPIPQNMSTLSNSQKILDIPVIAQPEMSSECGITSVAMIAKYYNINLSYEEIKKEIGMFS